MPEDGPIPSPLLQTYDKRASQLERAQRREMPEDGPIPNPLQQTYDKRFAKGMPGRDEPADPTTIPAPLQSSVGYIGANAFHRKGPAGGGRAVDARAGLARVFAPTRLQLAGDRAPLDLPTMPKKLSAKDLNVFQELLQRIRAVVSGDMSQLEEEAFGVGGQRDTTDLRVGDTADGYYQEFNLELLERDQSTVREIDEALERITAGSYGLCEACGEPILRERLKAMPHARNCIDCQRAAERNGQ